MESVEPVERRGVGGMINDKLYLLIVASTSGKIAVHKELGGSTLRPIHTEAYNDLLNLYRGNRHMTRLQGRVDLRTAEDKMWTLVKTVINIPTQISPIVVQKQIVDLVSDSSIGISDDYVIHRRVLPVPAGYLHFEKPLLLPTPTEVHSSPIVNREITGALFSPMTLKESGRANEKYTVECGVDGDMLLVVLFANHFRCSDGCGVVNQPVQSLAWVFGDSFRSTFSEKRGIELREQIEQDHEVGRSEASQHLLATNTLIKKLVALFEFMGQRIIASDPVSPDLKESRKRDRKLIAGYKGEVPDLTVVKLRRVYAGQRESEASTPLQRDIHWAVSGHWRNQPTNDGIKLIWINPYTKGNKSLPLRHGSRIFDVGR